MPLQFLNTYDIPNIQSKAYNIVSIKTGKFKEIRGSGKHDKIMKLLLITEV